MIPKSKKNPVPSKLQEPYPLEETEPEMVESLLVDLL